MELRYFIIRRLLLMIPTILGLTILVFFLLRLLPNSQLIQSYVPPNTPPAFRAQAEQKAIELLGLNHPAYIQYFYYLSNLFHGDWGFMKSAMYTGSVLHGISLYFPNTLQLAVFSIIVSVIIAIPLGTYIGARPNSAADQVGRVFSLVGYAMPAFWLALLLQVVFGKGSLPWFGAVFPLDGTFSQSLIGIPPPTWLVQGGTGGILVSSPTHLILIDSLIHGDFAIAWSSFLHLILPVLTLPYTLLAGILRFLRAGMVDSANQEYVKTARSKGVPESLVIKRHMRRNALLPTITVLGLLFATLLGGVVLVEIVFNYPGIGMLGVNAALGSIGGTASPQIYGVMGITLIFGLILIIANLVVDVIYALLDPRIRY